MDYIALILVAVSLAMDAFAVAICNGITIKNVKIYHAAVVGFIFGGSQFIMPLGGYFLGSLFLVYIESFAHWVAFALLAVIGVKMFLDTFRAGKECESISDELSFSFLKLFALGIATSIDALVVGASLPVVGWNIWVSAVVIGGVAFAFSFIGVLAGKVLGARYQKNASRLGALVLIGIGLKTLLEHFIVNG
ncbi:MAG: manganese efflux pump MntP family protein [Defluviitaleaceae bacterium]|nr:manganese efflux pump MntP family protein [Defluviitaleaceae bacterium]